MPFTNFKDRLQIYLGAVFILLILSSSSFARNPFNKEEAVFQLKQRIALANPEVQTVAHNRGKMQLAVSNNGTFGTFGNTFRDEFTGELIHSCVYPRNSDLVYLWVGAFWIGAVVNNDTLVSVGSEDYYVTSEFWPEEPNLGGKFSFNSIDQNSKFYNPSSLRKALSEQDVYAEYYDTLTDPGLTGQDETDNRPHIPLGVKVSQQSMAWSFDYADDFVLFDYQITNIGNKRLRKVYMGIWVDGDVWPLQRRGGGEGGWDDDVVGFLNTYEINQDCNFEDTIGIAYHLDNDGDPVGDQWNNLSPRSAVGVRLIRTPSDSLNFSFNWWIVGYDNIDLDFGPRRKPTENDPFRDMGRLGTPEGDRNKYYLLRHKEFDYNLYWSAVDQSLNGWLPPPANAETFADGFDSRYLLSFGPFDIDPGQTLPISFAWVGAEDVHVSPTAFDNLFSHQNPEPFFKTLDFSDLALNARWASWVYDNPGVDTDSDGYAGKFVYCTNSSGDIDSNRIYWYEGDGVPDFQGAGPPVSPFTNVIPSESKLLIRWNGYYTETEPDVFLGKNDFEGYRVYYALDDRDDSFTLLASYDIEDFNRYRWVVDSTGIGTWRLEETPFTLDSLRSLFSDQNFEPLRYPRNSPYAFNGETYYFEKQDFNISQLTGENNIRKAYPEITSPPPDDPLLWQEDEITYEHGEPLPKYYEYEYLLDSLLPTIPYYVSVTACDYGSPIVGLPALETQPIDNSTFEYPQFNEELSVLSSNESRPSIWIYPNPYRFDGSYRSSGYEGLYTEDRDKIDDRVRRIHFANLPAVCKIYIYSIDGDLIKEIDHNFPPGSQRASHDTWDLISRNNQLVVSGLYYWVVESETLNEIGKLVIIE